MTEDKKKSPEKKDVKKEAVAAPKKEPKKQVSDKLSISKEASGKEQAPLSSEKKPSVQEAPKKETSVKEEASKASSEPKKEVQKKDTPKKDDPKSNRPQLQGLFVFKEGMSSVYNDKRHKIPVTVLKYEPMVISQIKTPKNEGYSAVQVSFVAASVRRSKKVEKGHFKKAGFERSYCYSREVLQSEDSLAHVKLGQVVDIKSLQKGDLVKLTARSKGRGFSGVMKRL